MDSQFVQALMEMSKSRQMPTRVSELASYNSRKDYTYVDSNLNLPYPSSLQRAPKIHAENPPPLPGAFLDLTEPHLRGDLERLAAQQHSMAGELDHVLPDGPWQELPNRPLPLLAYMETRAMPSVALTSYNKEMEFGRTPDPTRIPLQPFTTYRPEEKEVTTLPERAVGNIRDFQAGNPVTDKGLDESRFLSTLIMNVPQRFLESTGQVAHPSAQLSMKTFEFQADPWNTPGGYRLKDDELLLYLLAHRDDLPGRDFGNAPVVADIVQRAKKNAGFEVPVPGATTMGLYQMGDARQTVVDVFHAPLPADRALDVSTRGTLPNPGPTFDQYTALGVQLLHEITGPVNPFTITRDDILDPQLHLQARLSNPFAIP